MNEFTLNKSKNIILFIQTVLLNLLINIGILMKLKHKQKQAFELVILICAVVFTVALWETPVIYPVKFFVIIIHEISHGIAAILTGDTVEIIKITSLLGGETVTTREHSFFIALSGYLGSIIFGALIFYSTYNKKYFPWINASIGVIIFLFTVNVFQGLFAILFGLLFSIILMIIPFMFNNKITGYIFKFFGIASILYILVDIKEDLLTLTIRQTDAQLLSEMSFIPAIAWGIFYFLLASATLFFLIRFGYKKGLG